MINCDVAVIDDESVTSLIQLDEYLGSFNANTSGSRDHDDVTDDNVADWILDHSDVTSGHEATRCHNVRHAAAVHFIHLSHYLLTITIIYDCTFTYCNYYFYFLFL